MLFDITCSYFCVQSMSATHLNAQQLENFESIQRVASSDLKS